MVLDGSLELTKLEVSNPQHAIRSNFTLTVSSGLSSQERHNTFLTLTLGWIETGLCFGGLLLSRLAHLLVQGIILLLALLGAVPYDAAYLTQARFFLCAELALFTNGTGHKLGVFSSSLPGFSLSLAEAIGFVGRPIAALARRGAVTDKQAPRALHRGRL